jgi:hypothetical protein
VRVALATVAALALAAPFAWGARALGEGLLLVATAAALSVAIVWPLARAAVGSSPAERLQRDPDGRWSIASIGAIEAPAVMLDGGSWMLLACRAIGATPAARTVWTWARVDRADAGRNGAGWSTLRRLLVADAATLAGAGR